MESESTATPLEKLGHALGTDQGTPEVRQRALARALGHALIDTLRGDAKYRPQLKLQPDPDKPAETLPLTDWLDRLLDATWPAEDSPEQQRNYEQLRATFEAIPNEDIRHAVVKCMVRLGHMHQMAGLLARDNLLQQSTDPSTVASFLEGNLGSKKGRNYRKASDAVTALNKPAFELTLTAHPTSTSSIASMQEQRELATAIARLKTANPNLQEVQDALRAFASTPILPMQGRQPRNLNAREECDYMLHYLANAYEDLPRTYASFDAALGKKFGGDYQPETLNLKIRFHSWGSSGDKDGNKKVNADSTLYAATTHYWESLRRQERALKALADLPGMQAWYERVTTARHATEAVHNQLKGLIDRGESLNSERYELVKNTLIKAVGELDAKAFTTDLEKAHAGAQGQQKEAALRLLRQTRIFGFSFGTIEYRETAEEYQRIVTALIPGYAGMDEKARQHALDVILSEPSKQAELATKLKELGNGAAGKPYSDDDIAPIAYQTLKRMELARDFPQLVQTQVLAECQQPSHLLEAQLLQHLAMDGQGKRPALGIVPLFEDGQRLKASPEIMRTALELPSYRAHIEEVAKTHGQPPAQQVQLAHSDNARRNGMPAARGLIYQAHDALRSMMKGYPGIALQFYEGGSQSDPYRGGARAVSATVNEFGIHDFTKMTYQGGDLLNYLNLPTSFFRLLTRNLTYSAAKLEQPKHLQRSTGDRRDSKIVEALDVAKKGYVDMFHGAEINDFMKSIGYQDEAEAAANGTRATGRSASEEVDVVKARTITYSEVLQHNGLAPTWLGAATLREELGKRVAQTQNPKGLHQLYLESPILKDVLDRVLYGVMRSDLDYLRERSHNHPLMGRFEQEYGAALALCYEAYTGQKVPALATPAEMRATLIDTAYPHVKDVLGDQDRYLELLRGIKRQWLPEGAGNHKLERRLIHNALDTVYHGRLPLVDDTTYAKLYCDDQGIERPFGPESKGRQ